MRILTLILIAILLPCQAWAFRAPPAQIIDAKGETPCVTLKESFLGNQPAHYGTNSKGPAIEIRNSCKEPIEIIDLETSAHIGEPASSRLPVAGDFHDKDGFRAETLTKEKSVKVPEGASLILPVEWGYHFQIKGRPDILLEGEMINPEDPVEMAKQAERGDAKARQRLGMYYISRKNFNKGLSVLLKGAEKGEEESLVQLAHCYTDRCSGFDVNKEEAYFWWALAAENSKGYMEYERDFAKRQLNPEQLSKVQQRLADWQKLHPPLPAQAKP